MRILKHSIASYGYSTEVVADIPAKSYKSIMTVEAPPDAKGFLYGVTIDNYVNGVEYHIVVDGSLEEKIEREGKIEYNPPIVFSILNIVVYNKNNSSVPVGVRVDAIFAKPVP